MAYEVIMGLSASYAIVFVGTFTEYPKEKVATIFAGAYWWTCSDVLFLLDNTGWSLRSKFRVFLYIYASSG